MVAPVAVTPAATAPASAVPQNRAEIEFWASIRNSNEAGEFRAYLTQYPKGDFVTLARLRLEAIESGRTASLSGARDLPKLDALKLEKLTALQKAAVGVPVTYADLEGRQFFAQQNYVGGHRGFEITFDFSGSDPGRIMVHGRLELVSGGGSATTNVVHYLTCPIHGFEGFKQSLQFTAYCRGNFMLTGDLSMMRVTFMLPGLDQNPVAVIDSSQAASHQEWTRGVRDNNTTTFFQAVLKESLIKSAYAGN